MKANTARLIFLIYCVINISLDYKALLHKTISETLKLRSRSNAELWFFEYLRSYSSEAISN